MIIIDREKFMRSMISIFIYGGRGAADKILNGLNIGYDIYIRWHWRYCFVGRLAICILKNISILLLKMSLST